MTKATVSTQTAELLASKNDWHGTMDSPATSATLRMLGAVANESGCSVKYPREGLSMADVQAAARIARFIGADATTAEARLEDVDARALKMRTPDRFRYGATKFEKVLIKNVKGGKTPLDCETANKSLEHCGISFKVKAPKKDSPVKTTRIDDDESVASLFA